MTDAPLRPEEKAAQEAIRSLSTPPADPAYRDRLRQAFASGSIESRIRPRPRVPTVLWLAPAAAAALVLAFVSNQGPRWNIGGVSGSGIVVVDGFELSSTDSAALGRAIRPGARLRTSAEVQIDLLLPGVLSIQVAPGSELVIPGSPGRWFARTSSGRVTEGEVRFVAGSRLRGGSLRITTPEARVDVTGTTLSVIREPSATCVCVLEGVVHMSPEGGPATAVRPGTRRYVYGDGRPTLVEPIRPLEVMKLTMLRDQAALQLGP